eukprot:jgi/Bigna1/70138/fgenesh1_pg.11_\
MYCLNTNAIRYGLHLYDELRMFQQFQTNLKMAAVSAQGPSSVATTLHECGACFGDLCSKQQALLVHYDPKTKTLEKCCNHIIHAECGRLLLPNHNLNRVVPPPGLFYNKCPRCTATFSDLLLLPNARSDPSLFLHSLVLDKTNRVGVAELTEAIQSTLDGVDLQRLGRALKDSFPSLTLSSSSSSSSSQSVAEKTKAEVGGRKNGSEGSSILMPTITANKDKKAKKNSRIKKKKKKKKMTAMTTTALAVKGGDDEEEDEDEDNDGDDGEEGGAKAAAAAAVTTGDGDEEGNGGDQDRDNINATIPSLPLKALARELPRILNFSITPSSSSESK